MTTDEKILAAAPMARGGMSTVDRDRIASAGLFDADWYGANCDDAAGDAAARLDHFLTVGLARGERPNATFDPALYRMLVPECGRSNPLVHWLDSGQPFQPPSLPELFPDIAAHRRALYPVPDFDVMGDLGRNRAHDPMGTASIEVTVGGAVHRLEVPPAAEFLDRLRNRDPFVYARIPHGFWNAVWARDEIARQMDGDPRTEHLEMAEREAVATRLAFALFPDNGTFTDGFLNEVMGDAVAGRGDRFFQGTAFKGYPTWDERLFNRLELLPVHHGQLALFARCFRPGARVLDALLWKRWLLNGDLQALPELCRPYAVTVVASRPFSTLRQRWGLDVCQHVAIPPACSQVHRRRLLEVCGQAVENARKTGRPPLVLTQCGGSLAYWLFARLHDRYPDATCIDLGQALNGWFLDVEELPPQRWLQIYAPVVMTRGGLAAFYRRWLGDGYEGWAARHGLSQHGAAHRQDGP